MFIYSFNIILIISTMDSIYFLIKVLNISKIELYLMKNKIMLSSKFNMYNYPICFTAFNVNLLISLLTSHDLSNLLSIQHCIYLGKELSKVEISIFIRQQYIQT